MREKLQKIYIIGSISDLSKSDAIEKFNIASLLLKFNGYEPVTPIELCSDVSDNILFDDIEHRIELLSRCDGIFLLRDWEESIISIIEKKIGEIIKSYNSLFEIVYEKDI